MRAAGAAATALYGLFVVQAIADDLPLNIVPILAEKHPERAYFFGGADAGSNSYSGWSGIVGAPTGHLDQDGPRFRIMAGTARYRYRTANVPGGVNHGNSLTGEIMFGWRSKIEAVVITAYLGGHAEHHRLRYTDPGNPVTGTRFGLKAAVELYTRINEAWFSSFSASGSSANLGYSARAVLMQENPRGHLLGTETALFGDERYCEWRTGPVAAAKLAGITYTLSGGYLNNSDRGGGGYVTLTLYAPY